MVREIVIDAETTGSTCWTIIAWHMPTIMTRLQHLIFATD
jgi:hypothetical protein